MKSSGRNIPMVVAGVGMLVSLGVLYAWSMFRVELSRVFPEITASQYSMNFTLAICAFGVGGFLGGKLSSRFSQRFCVRVSAGLIPAGLLLVSCMEFTQGRTAVALMYIGYGVITGTGDGMACNASLSGINPWFPGNRGLISGILLMGFGIGSLVLGLLAEHLSALMGIFNVFRLYAALIGLTLLGGSFFLRKPPLPRKVESGGGSPGQISFSPAQVLSRPSFWIHFSWNILMGSSGLLIINSAANISLYYGATAGLGMIVAVANSMGRPLVGSIVDILGQFKGMLTTNIMLILSGLLLLVVVFTQSVAALLAGFVLVGICYGSSIAISAKVISDLYGPEYYAVNLSLATFSLIPGSFIGPLVSGVLQDRSGGDYASTFIILLVFSVVCFAINFALRLRVKKEFPGKRF